MGSKKRCLIIKNDGIGDLVLASGLISEISKGFANTVLVTCIQNKEVAEAIPGVTQHFYCSRDSLKFHRSARMFGINHSTGTVDDKQLLKRLRQEQFDVAIILRRYIRESTFAMMNVVHAREKYCCWQMPTNVTTEIAHRHSRGWEHREGDIGLLSESSYFQHFLQDLFQRPFPCQPQLNFEIDPAGKSAHRTVGLGMGGYRRWPLGYWIELARKLHEDGWELHLFGGADGAHRAQVLEDRFAHCVNHVGKLDLRQSANAFSRLTAYIGNDTGLSHLAAMYVTTSLIVIGGGGFNRFFPWPETEGKQFIVHHGLDCYDCSWDPCIYGDQRCIYFISAVDVYEYFQQIVAGEAPQYRNLNPNPTEYCLTGTSVKRKLDATS